MTAAQPQNLLEYFENLVSHGVKKRSWYEWAQASICLAAGALAALTVILTGEAWLLPLAVLNFAASAAVLVVSSYWWQIRQRVNALLRAIDLEQKRESR